MSLKYKIVNSVLLATITSVTTAYAFMSHSPVTPTTHKTPYELIGADFKHHKAVVSTRDNQQIIHVKFTYHTQKNHQIIESIDDAYVTDMLGNVDKNYVLEREDFTHVVSVLEAV